MPKRLALRPLTDDKATTIHRLAHARTIPHRQWQRARIVWLASTGDEVAAIATALHLCQATVRHWLKRFNAAGVSGLEDASTLRCATDLSARTGRGSDRPLAHRSAGARSTLRGVDARPSRGVLTDGVWHRDEAQSVE